MIYTPPVRELGLYKLLCIGCRKMSWMFEKPTSWRCECGGWLALLGGPK